MRLPRGRRAQTVPGRGEALGLLDQLCPDFVLAAPVTPQRGAGLQGHRAGRVSWALQLALQ